jgi:hypothetical protein
MSHELEFSPSPFEQMTSEQRIVYVETHLESIIADLMANESIPYWHREILADHYRRYREQTEGGIPWEEVMKELEEEFGN